VYREGQPFHARSFDGSHIVVEYDRTEQIDDSEQLL
jgi:hypothetical protein